MNKEQQQSLLLVAMLMKIDITQVAQRQTVVQIFTYSNMISDNYLVLNDKSKPKNLSLKTSDQILQKIANGNIGKEQKEKIQNELSLLTNRPGKRRQRRRKNRYLEEAKFSSDSQQQAAHNDKRWFSEGSLLKIKTCRIVVYLNKGLADLQVDVLTQQSHKTILSTLFDPGFQTLSINKDKDQQQIIKYLQQSTKPYKYLICWFQAFSNAGNQVLKEIAREANERRRIFGWQKDNMKLHIMSLRQLKQIKRFKCPQKVGSKQATCFTDERLIMIMQYPDQIKDIKDLYQPFPQIKRIQNEYYTIVPFCEGETEIDRLVLEKIPPLLQKVAYPPITYEGWENQSPPKYPQPQIKEEQAQKLDQAVISPNKNDRINEIRLHFGFSQFQEILTDQQEIETLDLATQLLNSIKTVPPLPLVNPMRQALQHSGYNEGYQYYGYNGGYNWHTNHYDNAWQQYPIQQYQSMQLTYPNNRYLPTNNNKFQFHPQYFQPTNQFPLPNNDHRDKGQYMMNHSQHYY